jgi:hypothetical protein
MVSTISESGMSDQGKLAAVLAFAAEAAATGNACPDCLADLTVTTFQNGAIRLTVQHDNDCPALAGRTPYGF